MTAMPRSSAVICTRNRPGEMAAVMRSLQCQSLPLDELIVVDASDNEETARVVKEMSGQAGWASEYHRSPPCASRQRNIGFGLSHGEYLFFFDDDVVLETGYIEAILSTFDSMKGEGIGGMTGRITNLTGASRPVAKLLKNIFFLSDVGRGNIKLSGFPTIPIQMDAGFVDMLSGCNMVYARDAFSKHLFDEKLGDYSYMEDVDLATRVGREYRLYYQPDARLEHRSSTYIRADPHALRKRLAMNHRYLFLKNTAKDVPHIFAFCMSVIGLLVYNALIERDIRACQGIVSGLVTRVPCPRT